MLEGPSAHLNLGCLSIFWTPKTPEGKVDLFLAHALLDETRDSWPERMSAYGERFLKMLNKSDPGALFNFSAIVHETRHFHDLLLTVWGQGAFAHALDAIYKNLRLFRALQQTGVSMLSVPVIPEDFPDLKELVTKATCSVHLRDEFWQSGDLILEMLAYWTQSQFVWMNVEDPATLEHFCEHIRDQSFYKVAAQWSQFGSAWEVEAEEWAAIGYQLLVACLNAAPNMQFNEILQKINPGSMPWSKAKALFNELLPNMEEKAEKDRSRLVKWTAHIRECIKKDKLLKEADRMTLVGLIDSYYDKQARLLDFVREDPRRFRSVDGYISGTILAGSSTARVVAPRTYCYYPSNFSFVHPGIPSELPDDFFDMDVYESAPRRVLKRLSENPRWGDGIKKAVEEQPGWNCSAVELRVHPVPNLFSGKADNVMPTEWGCFARDLAGCVVLSEGISWDDPVRYHWAKKTARNAGLTLISKHHA